MTTAPCALPLAHERTRRASPVARGPTAGSGYPRVVDWSIVQARSTSFQGPVERITPFEELDLNDVRLDCTVCVGGVEATESNDVRVEFGERDDGVEVVVERACRFAPTPSYAVLKVLFALDRVLRSRRAVGKSR